MRCRRWGSVGDKLPASLILLRRRLRDEGKSSAGWCGSKVDGWW